MQRRRSITQVGQIPEGVARWFAGEATCDAAGWYCLLQDFEDALCDWWLTYADANPVAMPPTDSPWVRWPVPAAPPPKRQRAAAAAAR